MRHPMVLGRRAGWVVVAGGVALSGCGGNVQVQGTGGGGAAASGEGAAGAGGAGSAGGGGSAGGANSGVSVTSGVGGSPGSSGVGGSQGGGSPGSGGEGGCVAVFVVTPCRGHLYTCGDGIDNDGDGLVDWQDPECLGPCDNTEDSYWDAITWQAGAPCNLDCAFDADGGPGNDDCYWDHRCDPLEAAEPGHPEPSYQCPYAPDADVPGTPAGTTCADLMEGQSAVCQEVCGAVVPNGCDCFGCCELIAGSGDYRWINSKDEETGEHPCVPGNEADATKCEPCTPVTACFNSCETCELCVGKPSLPAECAGPDGAPQQACPDGAALCGLPCQPVCPAGTFCVTGCCQAIPPP